MEIYSHPDIAEILLIPGNSSCCDCGAPKPKWASLNNGVFLCLNCAGIHRSASLQISVIKSLQIDQWTEKQILYLNKGGNIKFKENLKEYNIPETASFDLKYKTKASEYYRQKLRDEVEFISSKDYQKQAMEKPGPTEGLEILRFPEGNVNVDNNLIIGNSPNLNNNNKGNSSSGSGFFSFFGGVVDSVKGAVGAVGQKFDELKIKEKIVETGNTALGYAKVAGNAISTKTKEAMNSQFIQNIQNKMEAGLNTVLKKGKEMLGNEGNKGMKVINHPQVNPEAVKNIVGENINAQGEGVGQVENVQNEERIDNKEEDNKEENQVEEKKEEKKESGSNNENPENKN